MNRKIKKIAAVFLTLLMFIAAVPGQMLTAYAATGKITFSDPTVTVGNQVKFEIVVTVSC